MKSFITLIKEGKAANATALIEQTLREKTFEVIKESKEAVAAKIYDTEQK